MKWTPEETAACFAAAGKLTANELADVVDRPSYVVHRYCQRMGITLKREVRMKPLKAPVVADMPSNYVQRWSDERKAEAIRLYDSGLSASEIARRMGAASRSAVLGIIHRNRPCGTVRAKTPKNARLTAPPPRLPRPARLAQPTRAAPRAKPAPMPLQAAPSPAVKRFSIAGNNKVLELGATQALPQERPHDGPVVALLNLGSCQCKFPIGTPGADEFGFCGKKRPAGEPYCDDHRRVCWRPVPASTQRRSDSQSEYLARRAR